MDLTTAKKAEVTAAFEAVRNSFNSNIKDPVNAISAALLVVKNSTQSPDVQACIDDAFNPVIDALNAAIAPLHAAIAANLARVPVDPPVNTPPLFSNDLSSDALIQRDFWHANVFYNPGPSLPTVNNPSKWIGGMLEVPIILGLNSNPGIGGTGCSWHWWMPAAIMAMQELWAEYDFYIDPDVPAGFNEEGCKLPGLAGAWEQPGQWAEPSGAYGWFSARLWHRRPDAAGNCELAGYVYSARSMDAGNPFGELIATGKMLRPGVKYKLGQHIKLNSRDAAGKWLSDGVFEILLDGVVVFSDTAFKMRADPRATFQDFFVNIFHGGSQPVKAPIHYRIGGVVVDNKPIPWKPPVIIDNGPRVPAWRQGLPIGQWVDVPNTAAAKTLPGMRVFFDGSFSGVASDRINSVVYLPASAGHDVSDDNHVAAIDLKQDAPAWGLQRDTSGASAGTPNAAYHPDGRPTGCHLYYSGQVVQIGGKSVVLQTLITAASLAAQTTPQHTNAFHPDRNDWDLNGAGWGTFQTQWKDNAVALDARTGRIYVQTQGGETGMLDTATGKWTPTGFASNGWGYGWGGSVVDPVLDELLYDFGGYRHGGDFFEGLHLTRNVRITHPYTWQGTPCRSADQYRGMVIDEIGRAIYLVASGGDPAFFNKLDLTTWTMTNLGTVPQPNTVYNRIEHFPRLGGIAHFPAHGSNMRFFALA